MFSLELLWSLFGDVLIAVWFGLTVLAAIAGVWALLSPNSFVEFNRRLSTWIALSEAPSDGSSRYSLERPFYRYHLLTGPLILLAGFYVLYQAIVVLGSADIGRMLGADASVTGIWIGVLVDAAFGWIYISCAMAIVIGIIVTIRPSYLKGVETRLNTWVDTAEKAQLLDRKINILDEWVCGHPRVFGIISLLASLLIATFMVVFGVLA